MAGIFDWKRAKVDCGLPRWLRGLKNPPAVQKMQETQVQSLGQEDPLEKETATHSSIVAWKIPWTEDSGGLQCPVGHDRVTGQGGLPSRYVRMLALLCDPDFSLAVHR